MRAGVGRARCWPRSAPTRWARGPPSSARAVAERPGHGDPRHRVRAAVAGGARGRAAAPDLLRRHARVLAHPGRWSRGWRSEARRRRPSRCTPSRCGSASSPGSTRSSSPPPTSIFREGTHLRRRRRCAVKRVAAVLELPALPTDLPPPARCCAARPARVPAELSRGRRRPEPGLDRDGGALMCTTCGCGDPELVPVELHEKILAGNDRAARHNREHFVEAGVLARERDGQPRLGQDRRSSRPPPARRRPGAGGSGRSPPTSPPTTTPAGSRRPASPPAPSPPGRPATSTPSWCTAPSTTSPGARPTSSSSRTWATWSARPSTTWARPPTWWCSR